MSIAPEEFKFKQTNIQKGRPNLNKLKLKINQKTFEINNQKQTNKNFNSQIVTQMIIADNDIIGNIGTNNMNSQKQGKYQGQYEGSSLSIKRIPKKNDQQLQQQNSQIQSYQSSNIKSLKKSQINSKKCVLSIKNSTNICNTNQIRQQFPQQNHFLQQASEDINKQPCTAKNNFFSQQSLNKVKQKIKALLQRYFFVYKSISFQIFITLITIASLFMQDFRTIFVDKSHDQDVDMINITFLVIFSTQIILSLTSENYFGSFFFYLDCISTVSIIMDVTIFTNIIYDSGGNSQQLNIIIAQSKASRAAARAVRIMKIFRLARVVKLYKSALKAKQMNQKKQQELIKQRQRARQKMKRRVTSNYDNNMQDGTNSEYKMSSNIISKNSLVNNTISQKSQRDSRKINQIITNIITQRTSSQRSNMNKLHIVNSKNKNSIQYARKPSPGPINFIRQEPQQIEKQDQIQNGLQNSQGQDNQQYHQGNGNQGQQLGLKQDPKFSMIQINKKQSNISKILSDTTIKKIIIVILIIMFSVTIFDVSNYHTEDSAWDFMCDYIATLLQSPNISVDFINNMIQQKVNAFSKLAINTPFDQLYYLQLKDYSLMRIDEVGLSQSTINITNILLARPYLTVSGLNYTSSNIAQIGQITVVFDCSSFNVVDSWFSISRIIFICLTILYLLQSFNSSITNLIVTPIQQMLQIVMSTQSKQNPKDAEKLNSEDQQNQNLQFRQARYESNIVQKAIIKIRSLMSTIFGKMGMDLIYHQLFVKESTVQDYLQSSKKRFCIYGICRIQNFTQIAQILSEDIFIFTNQIAQIVHSAVYRYGGHGVKNLKDGFLITFALPQSNQQQIIKEAFKKAQTKQAYNNYLNILSDYAVFSFTKILIKLHKEPKILQYKKDQKLLQKFGNSFEIKMNFALSLGQSIQGIIGSQIKIDPIYLGGKIADVSKISSISTKYPNTIILQQKIYRCLTHSLQRHCRIMDFVKLNKYDEGNTQLYIIDLDLQYISPSRNKADKLKSKEQHPDIHLKRWINMQNLKDNIQMDNYDAQEFINGKKQLREVLRKVVSQQIKKKYQMAFSLYASRQWLQAKQQQVLRYLSFQQILKMTKEDLLTNRIYKYIKKHQFKSEGLPKYKPIQQI